MRQAHLVTSLLLLAFVLPAAHAEHLMYTDAELLALEITGALTPPSDVVAQIDLDLAAIRMLDTLFTTIHAAPDWEPGEILVLLTPEAWAEYQQGTYSGFDALNQQYGPVEASVLFESLRLLRLQFGVPYHPWRLFDLYGQVAGVEAAQPNFVSFNGTGGDIRSNTVGTYTFVFGWGGCVPSCAHEHFWTFSVAEGRVALLEQGGDPLAVDTQSWSQVKRAYR